MGKHTVCVVCTVSIFSPKGFFLVPSFIKFEQLVLRKTKGCQTRCFLFSSSRTQVFLRIRNTHTAIKYEFFKGVDIF